MPDELEVTQRESVVIGHKDHKPHVYYSEDLAEYILNEFATKKLSEICNSPGMPTPTTVHKWMRENKLFRDRFQTMRMVKALVHEEQALEAAESAFHKDDVPAARLKFDAHKWAAEINDPGTYGKKTTIEGNPDKPLTFIIQSGFPEPTGYQKHPEIGPDGLIQKAIEIEAKSEIIQEATDGAGIETE